MQERRAAVCENFNLPTLIFCCLFAKIKALGGSDMCTALMDQDVMKIHKSWQSIRIISIKPDFVTLDCQYHLTHKTLV